MMHKMEVAALRCKPRGPPMHVFMHCGAGGGGVQRAPGRQDVFGSTSWRCSPVRLGRTTKQMTGELARWSARSNREDLPPPLREANIANLPTFGFRILDDHGMTRGRTHVPAEVMDAAHSRSRTTTIPGQGQSGPPVELLPLLDLDQVRWQIPLEFTTSPCRRSRRRRWHGPGTD